MYFSYSLTYHNLYINNHKNGIYVPVQKKKKMEYTCIIPYNRKLVYFEESERKASTIPKGKETEKSHPFNVD